MSDNDKTIGGEPQVDSMAGSVSQRLIEAEDILSDLSTGFWVSTLDDSDAPVNEKMGQRVLNYWKKQNGAIEPHPKGD